MASYKQYMNMDLTDFLSMDRAELIKGVSVLGKVVNSRYKSLKKTVGSTPATESLISSGGLINAKNKTYNQLRAEFVRAKNFLEKKSSSISGYKKIINQTINTLSKQGVDISKSQFNDFWNIYEKVKERDPMVADRQYRYKILENITTNMENMSPDEVVNNALNEMTRLYESTEIGNEYNAEFWRTLFKEQR